MRLRRMAAVTTAAAAAIVLTAFTGNGINGPWDMTALDLGGIAQLFVTNVLNGTVAANGNTVNRGTVLRLTLAIVPGGLPKLVATLNLFH